MRLNSGSVPLGVSFDVGAGFVCASASSSVFALSPEPVVEMREAREWLEGRRRVRASKLAWEYPAPPAFAA